LTGAMVFGYGLKAADCRAADSLGCFDREGNYYPNDIKGLAKVEPAG